MVNILAWLLARPFIVDLLIRLAKRTPYMHIMSPDGAEVYMERYWLFNPYPAQSAEKMGGLRRHLPSIRLHRIMRKDGDRDLHDHPWRARTFILDGWYVETRRIEPMYVSYPYQLQYTRVAGDTATLKFNEYHRIDEVSAGGVWTLFVTWKYQGVCGFLVDGKKVPWRTYLGLEPKP